MGNSFRRLACSCFEPSTSDQFQSGGQHPGHNGPQAGPHGQHNGPLGPHGITVNSAGFAALARDLFQFETTNKVPERLSEYVKATKVTQAGWYRKLLAAWKSAQPAPTTAGEASTLLRQTLQGHRNADVQGLLFFYRLPGSDAGKPAVAATRPPVAFVAGGTWPQGVQYELRTLPVNEKGVADGDTITVFVDVLKDAREIAAVPQGIMEAVRRRRTAQANHDYISADALQTQIQQAGYKYAISEKVAAMTNAAQILCLVESAHVHVVIFLGIIYPEWKKLGGASRVFNAKNGKEECLARKYRIRLKGVDAPESKQPYGQQAKAVLNGLVEGRPLLIHVYTVDQYGRLVGDIHCNGVFIQEALFKKGCVWHYTQYDHRLTFAQWEKAAKAARVGLWAVADPEKPWEYRKNRRDSRTPSQK